MSVEPLKKKAKVKKVTPSQPLKTFVKSQDISHTHPLVAHMNILAFTWPYKNITLKNLPLLRLF
jgi:hypothetical protein